METTTRGTQLSERLSQRLANYKLSDAVIGKLAERITLDGMTVARFHTCIYGICVDYLTDKFPGADVLQLGRGISKWEVFPYGIINWDRFRVLVGFNVDELEGRGFARDIEH